MDKIRQAAQQALEALENAGEAVYAHKGIAAVGSLNTAAQALRAALAEPEKKAKPITAAEMSAWVNDTWEKCQAEAWQEPVAWRVRRSDGQYELYFLKAAAERAAECYIKRPPVEPLYTAPPTRKPLTVEQLKQIEQDIARAALAKAGASNGS